MKAVLKRIPLTLAVAATAVVVVAGYSIDAAAAGDRSGAGHQSGHAAGANPGPRVAAVEKAGAPARESSVSTTSTATASTPEGLLRLLGERIVAKDVEGIVALHEPTAALVDYDLSIVRGHQQIREFYLAWFKSNPVLTVNPLQTLVTGGQRTSDGRVVNRTASIMGTYSLEQTAADGTRESFTGNFCDVVRQQPNGTWKYLQDNPYPPHS